MVCRLLLLSLLLGAVLARPLPLSDSYLVPEEFSAPLELPQEHFGLVDDYGIKPKQPHLGTPGGQEQLSELRGAGKSKHDELDLEYYDETYLCCVFIL